MGLNSYNLKKWLLMLCGKSISHVHQDVGKIYSKDGIRGYYNDLTLKVLKGEGELIPIQKLENGECTSLPTEVFQYGLGAYDLYLLTKEIKYFNIFEACSRWAIDHVESNGAWNNFYFIYPQNPYSSMTQGEGVSLLLRAYITFQEDVFFNVATKAIEFMLTPVNEGGTSVYENDSLILMEYTHLPPVLNGWIFSLFGLFDYAKITNDKKFYHILHQTLDSLITYLPNFDAGYWSKYDSKKTIASPFYHSLHISLLEVIYDLFGDTRFLEAKNKYTRYRKNILNRIRAFVVKAWQKIKE